MFMHIYCIIIILICSNGIRIKDIKLDKIRAWTKENKANLPYFKDPYLAT